MLFSLLQGKAAKSSADSLSLTLNEAPVGGMIRITDISEPETAMVALRLGIAEGEMVTLISKIPGGPVVLRQGQRELALGRSLCQSIGIEILPVNSSAVSRDKVGFPTGAPISCFQ